MSTGDVRSVDRQPWWVWALWATLLSSVLICPMLLAEPMIVYLLDPELLVLAIVFGTQQGRIEAGITWLRFRLALDIVLQRTPARSPAASLERGWALQSSRLRRR